MTALSIGTRIPLTACIYQKPIWNELPAAALLQHLMRGLLVRCSNARYGRCLILLECGAESQCPSGCVLGFKIRRRKV